MRSLLITILLLLPAAVGQVKEVVTEFEVRYVATGAVYLSGGREEGLQEGFHLTVRRRTPGEPTLSAKMVARIIVSAVASHSAVCEIESAEMEPQSGDIAQVASADLESIQALRQSSTARRYAQVVTFTEGDPLEQELRDYVPRPPLTEVNRASGRVSLEYNAIHDPTSHITTHQNGVVVRADVTRIAGTYWNLTGYWRARFNRQSGAAAQTRTLRDVLNRTYHLGLYYNNPQSSYTIGVGRLMVPWATNLNTLDGAYLGRRLNRYWTVGAFGGSTPDPTAWDYKPGRQIGGGFLNLVAGALERQRFTGTVGVAISRLHWKAEREYAFSESIYSWKNRVSVFHNLQADRLTMGRLGNNTGGAALSRSFLTLRVQATPWLSVDAGHNYLRGVPTFDTILISTGLLDQYLFTGFNAGVRLDLPQDVSVYGSVGQSKRSDDRRGALTQTFGVTLRNFSKSGVRLDIRHAKFHSSFGSGWYQLVSLSRQFGDQLRLDAQAGGQQFRSPVSPDNRALWISTTLDWFLGRHYVLNSGVTLYRGEIQRYVQTFMSFGYRY